MNNNNPKKYLGIAFVIKNEIESQLEMDSFYNLFSKNPQLIDKCNNTKEMNYLKNKVMIVFEKYTDNEKTILIDKSDKNYFTIAFLLPSVLPFNEILDPEGVACHLFSQIQKFSQKDTSLTTILEKAVFIFIGRYFFQGSSEEEVKLSIQDRHIQVKCKKFCKNEIFVDKMFRNNIPHNDCWKNVKNIHKILIDLFNEEAFRFFYQRKFDILEEETKTLHISALSLSLEDFYNKLFLLKKEAFEIEHRIKNIDSIYDLLKKIRKEYESQTHLRIQESLERMQRKIIYISIFSIIISAIVIGGVGRYQISTTKEIGLIQTSIMEDQTKIMERQSSMQLEELNRLFSGNLEILGWEPQPLLVTLSHEQNFLKVYIRNTGNVDVIITKVYLIFPTSSGSTFMIDVSDFSQTFEEKIIKGSSSDVLSIPINPYENETIRNLISEEFLNRDLFVMVRIHNPPNEPLEFLFRLTIKDN